MTTPVQDLRYAIRGMKRTPGFTAAAIATLALGLGLNSAVLSLSYALFLKPLPLDGAADLVTVDQTLASRSETWFTLSHLDYLYYREHATAFADLAAHYPTSPMHVSADDGSVDLMGSVVTASYFNVLRLRPALGRFFTAEEDRVPGQHPVAILSHDLWRTRFGGAETILGTDVRINGTSFSVIGIAPRGFRGIVRGVPPVDIWIPTAMFAAGYRYCDGLARGCAVMQLVGRLKEDSPLLDAQADMDVLARQLESAFPETNKGRGVRVRAARGVRMDEQARNAPIVGLLAGAAALVLLASSANVAGLLLGRGLHRRKEIAIRLALGAGRARLIRQLLVESVALTVAGGAAGLIVAVWAADVLHGFFGVSAVGDAVNFDLSLDLRVVAAGFALALVTGVVTGLAPALQATRPDTLPALKDDAGGLSARRSTLRDVLMVLQVAVAMVLVVCSGLLLRSFFTLHRGPGFDPDTVVLLRVRPSLVGYSNERAWAFQREAIRRLEAIPGVAAAGLANVPHLPGWARRQQPIQLTGDTGDLAQAFRASTTHVGPRYFQALGGGVMAGREFDDRDTADGPRVAVINEALARRLFPQGGAVGQRLTVDGQPREVVGIVRDLQFLSALDEPEPIVYLDYWQQDRTDNWSSDSQTHVRVSGDAAAIIPQIRRTIAEIDPDVPISSAQVLGDRLDYAFFSVRAARALLAICGGLALVLSSIGLYATLAFGVAQRTREIAIRIALGATRGDIGRLVIRRGAAVVSLGVAVGLVASVIAGPVLASLLYGVSPRDPLALAAAPCVLGLVALVAIWLPARRAMAMDPRSALRWE